MVFALETYCAASDGRSAARIEEEVVVTADGVDILTKFPGRGAAGDRQGLRARRRPAGRLRGAAADVMQRAMLDDGETERAAEGRRSRRSARPRRPSTTSSSTGACGSSAASRTRSSRCSSRGEVHGTTHLCSGQEAVAGRRVQRARADEDRVAGTYRGHGHALALGVEPEALMDELLGRATGVCGGRAGSMNVIDLEHRLIGCFGIVGGSIAAATGVGARAQAPRRRRGRLLRRRRHQPGLLPRVPELRQGRSRCRWSSSARTTSTASSRRSRTSPPGEIRARAEALGHAGRAPSTATTSGRCARPRREAVGARARGRRPARSSRR